MHFSLRCAVVVFVGCGSTGCISKGDTNLTSNAQTRNEDEAVEDAGRSRPSMGDDDEPEPSATEPEPRNEPAPAPETDDDESEPEPATAEPEPTEPTPEPDDATPSGSGGMDPTGEPAGGMGGTVSEPEPQPEPAANGGSGGMPATVATVACTPDSGTPVVGTVEVLTEGDLVDKGQFGFAKGSGEDFLVWIDPSPGGPALGWLTRDALGATDPGYLDFQAETTTPGPYVTAVFSPDAASGAGAYALAWRNASSVQFNWLAGETWVLDEPSDNPGQFTFPYVTHDGMAMAYDGMTYGIVPLAQHPYLLFIDAVGTGTIVESNSTQFTRQEARDVVLDDDGNFITLGRYHDGSIITPMQLLNLFHPNEAAGTPVQVTVFEEYGLGNTGPRGLEVVWDGSAVGVVYGGDPESAGLQYGRVTTAGQVALHAEVVGRNLTPLDAFIDRDEQVIYVLSTDAEEGLHFVAFDVASGDVLIENATVAAGSGITEGYLSWDDDAERLRAYFAAVDDGGTLHQISTTLIECRE